MLSPSPVHDGIARPQDHHQRVDGGAAGPHLRLPRLGSAGRVGEADSMYVVHNYMRHKYISIEYFLYILHFICGCSL